VLTVMASTLDQNDDASRHGHVTVFLFLALSGLADVLVYYCGYAALPEGVQSFCLALAFAVQTMVAAAKAADQPLAESRAHAALAAAAGACSLAAALEVSRNEMRFLPFISKLFAGHVF